MKLLGGAKISDKLTQKIVTIEKGVKDIATGGWLERRALRRIKERFIREVDADGRPWPALSPSTHKKFAVMGPGKKLVDSGFFYRDIQVVKGTTAQGPGTKKTRTALNFEIGAPNTINHRNGVNYANLHQTGTPRMPARPWLGVNKLDIRSLRRMVNRLLLGQKVRI